MNIIEKLVEEYVPGVEKSNVEALLRCFSAGIIKELERYSDTQYRKYRSCSDPKILGTSEGTDHCIELIKKLLD